MGWRQFVKCNFNIGHSIIILSTRWMIYMSDTCFMIITFGFFDEINLSLRTKYYFCSFEGYVQPGQPCLLVGQGLTNSLSRVGDDRREL